MREKVNGFAVSRIGWGSMKKIIIVDDDPSLTAVLKAVLKEKYAVSSFSNGLAALDAAPAIKPDLIITDVLMPEMTGFELLVNLKREDSPFRDTPVLVMSVKESVKNVFDQKDMVCFLPKPFSTAEFRNKIDEILNRKIERQP